MCAVSRADLREVLQFPRVTGRAGPKLKAALAGCAAAALAAVSAPALADEGNGAASGYAIDKKIAVLGLDALGVDEERVQRLESLFRQELARLAGKPTPSRKEIKNKLRRTKLARCGGETKCLAAIGRHLKVDLVVSGNVASLGDSYVVNIKVVDSLGKNEIRRISSDPLRGESDELIEPIRVAAYRLLAPDKLKGSVAILADIEGASVELDGKPVGKTPLKGPISNLEIGKHKLRVTAAGFSAFEEEITVRFQKSSRVVVRLAGGGGAANLAKPIVTTRSSKPWYNRTWFYVTVGVAAVAVGGVIGYSLAKDEIITCPSSQCTP